MDSSQKNFGPRLRAYIEHRGTIESAYADLGVSRATLFNWFNRDRPPPGKEMIERLRKYLGEDADWILDGVQKIDHAVQESLALFGSPQAIELQIRNKLEDTLRAAAGDSIRLGWILSQLNEHVTPQSHWSPNHAAAVARLAALKQQVAQGKAATPGVSAPFRKVP